MWSSWFYEITLADCGERNSQMSLKAEKPHLCIHSLERLGRDECCMLEASLGYIGSARLDWAAE